MLKCQAAEPGQKACHNFAALLKRVFKSCIKNLVNNLEFLANNKVSITVIGCREMLLTYHSLTMLLTSMCSPMLLIIYPLKNLCALQSLIFSQISKLKTLFFFLLLHFFFLFKEILKKNRMKHNFKTFFSLFWWENFQMTAILGNEQCTIMQ